MHMTITETIIGALLPILVTLLLGLIARRHHDFGGRQAAILNRMVMLICAAHLPYIEPVFDHGILAARRNRCQAGSAPAQGSHRHG